MKNRDILKLMRRHPGKVMVDALVNNDVIGVQAVRADLIAIMKANPDGRSWDANVTDGVIYLHPADDA